MKPIQILVCVYDILEPISSCSNFTKRSLVYLLLPGSIPSQYGNDSLILACAYRYSVSTTSLECLPWCAIIATSSTETFCESYTCMEVGDNHQSDTILRERECLKIWTIQGQGNAIDFPTPISNTSPRRESSFGR
jgi:hypothetical protein